MRAHRTIVTASVLVLSLFATRAHATRNCLSTVANDTCVTAFLSNFEKACGSDLACHLVAANEVQLLAGTPAGTALCAALVAAVKTLSGCP